jgi:hypothetical protein
MDRGGDDKGTAIEQDNQQQYLLSFVPYEDEKNRPHNII